MEGCWSANEPLSERALAANKQVLGGDLPQIGCIFIMESPQIIFIMGSPSNLHHLHLRKHSKIIFVMESTQIIIIFIMECPQIVVIFILESTQIFIIPVIIFILENIQIVIVTSHHNVDVDANQLGHRGRAEKRGQEASLSSKARQGRPGQKKLRKKRRGDDKLVGPGH